MDRVGFLVRPLSLALHADIDAAAAGEHSVEVLRYRDNDLVSDPAFDRYRQAGFG